SSRRSLRASAPPRASKLTHEDEHLRLHDVLGPSPLVVHLGPEVVALHALGAQRRDLVILEQAAEPELREFLVVRELQTAILAFEDRAEDVADVAIAVPREQRALLAGPA